MLSEAFPSFFEYEQGALILAKPSIDLAFSPLQSHLVERPTALRTLAADRIPELLSS